jgi:DNA-directed RNA polymerase subunit alpha
MMDTMTTHDLAALLAAEPFDTAAIHALQEAAFESTESLNRLLSLLAEMESGAASNPAQCCKLGVCYLFLADNQRALEKLEKAAAIPVHAYYLGLAKRELRRYQEAAAEFEKAARAGADKLDCDLQRAECLLLAGETETAAAIVQQHAGAADTSANCRYAMGRLEEERGELDKAIQHYEAAINMDQGQVHAMFRLAYLLDLHGSDERAIELYKQCAEQPFVFSNALINLAVSFEDEGDYENAIACLERVLSVNPNHPRANLYLKDVLACLSMYIDETQLRVSEKRDAVLDIPVSDFELSVRSRNCLKKMNINTLGDLLKITEAELLAYKNFGETSLKEIKAMLAQKGLSLGQNAHLKRTADGWVPAASPAAAAPAAVAPDIATRPLSAIELSVRSRKCLQRLGLATIGELVNRSETELLESKNFGQTSLREIKSKLAEMGLALRQG